MSKILSVVIPTYNMEKYLANCLDSFIYDKNTNELIKIHDSIKDAAAAVNVDRSCISRCCSGKKKSSRGFVWRFI